MDDWNSKISAILNELESVQLEPVIAQTTESAKYEIIILDGFEEDNVKWKALIAEQIKTAKKFEIHCWTEEQKEIELALQYGTVSDSNWNYGKVIVGVITTEFEDMLLHIPKPIDTVFSNKMTPFFSIFFDNGFSSEHYGTENIIKQIER